MSDNEGQARFEIDGGGFFTTANEISSEQHLTLRQPRIVSAFFTVVYDNGAMSQHAVTAKDEEGLTIEVGNAKSPRGGSLP